jgi:hypothetical protein
MSNEIRVQGSLQVNNGSLQYQSRPSSYSADMANEKGAAPGRVLATPAGVSVVFPSGVGPGGVAFVQNLGTSPVEYGLWDAALGRFLPLLEMLPGEFHVVRLSRELGREFGTGTGTGVSVGTSSLRLRSIGASSECVVMAFAP